MLHHLRLAARMLLKTPFVSGIAILSLALGIGANSAIFSIFDQLLLRPLPVPTPGQLVNLDAPGPKPGMQSCSQAGDCDAVFSYPMFRDLERQQTTLTGLAAHIPYGFSLAIDGEPMIAQGAIVSGSYFPTLQLIPAAGRLLTPDDDRTVGGHAVAVLGWEFWRDRFALSPAVVGRSITVNGRSFTVVGVAPRGFRGTVLGALPSVYIPLTMRAAVEPGFERRYENRRAYWVYLFGRLKPGVTLAQADAQLNTIYRPLVAEVEAPLQEGMSAPTLARFKAKRLGVAAGPQGQSRVIGSSRTPVLLLLGVTGVVLLIACANIANLLLARGAGRATEMGVRLALGASRGQLVALLLTEAVLLALAGGAVSLLVARGTLGLIGALMPPQAASGLRLEMQPSVLVFTAGLSLVTGLLFGLFPALQSTRSDLIGVIRAGAGQLTGGRTSARFRATLVTAQIALSMALLVSAGLFLRSLLNVSRVALGMRLDDVVMFSLSPEQVGMDSLRRESYFRRVEETLAALPGVTGVTSALVPILGGNSWGNNVRVQGFPCGPDIDCNARFNAVGAGYFTMLGVPLIAGRDFAASDAAGGARVAIVNERFARKFNLGREAVGKFINTEGRDSLNVQIVGLAPDVGYSDVKDTVPPVFYLARQQDRGIGALYFYVRGTGPASRLLAAIPPAMKQLDPTVPVDELRTMPQQLRENVFMDRMISILSAAFAILATLLAAVGLYGVLAFSVAQRTREIGVRMALGADAARVRGLVLRQVGLMTLVGGLVGVAGALGLGKAARALLFGLEAHDAVTFALAVVLLAGVALAAGYLPARRAAQVNPMQALRHD